MGRPKKIQPMTTEESISASTEVVEEKVTLIQPVSIDFGREDLNTLGRKVNEIIERINQTN